MGYFDKYLMHEDGRDKGMNSTSSEKGTDGKKNNTSEYNHQYYMKNKDKWRDNDKSSVNSKYSEYDENDKDFDESNYNEKNRLGDTNFFGFQKPDGSWVILEEDMKWTLPAGLNKNELIKALEDFDKSIESSRQNGGKWTFEDWQKGATNAINKAASGKSGGEKEFDVDAAARDVIRGKYGNGAERRAALGDDYAEVQKRVNEILGGKTSSEPKKTSKNTSKPVDGPKETPHANFPSGNSTSSAPRAREKNVTGTGTGLYRRDKVEDNKPRKREKNITGSGTGLYTRGKVTHAEKTFNTGYFYSDDELAHHGIKGQRWGVRRFEKAGGGLTPAGKARYQTDSNGNYKKVTGKTTSDAYVRYKKSIKLADKAESRYNANSDNTKALSDWDRHLKDADAAKKEFTRADKKQYKADKKAEKAANHKGLSEKQKKALKIGAAVTATALATYGVYKVSQLNKKATEGIRKDATHKAKLYEQFSNLNRQNAYNMRQTANNINNNPVTKKAFLDTANRVQKGADEQFMEALHQQSIANRDKYSTKEKVNYLIENNDVANFTMNLLKKNNATLSSLGF